MNERLMRAAPQYFAEFITAFEDGEQRTAPQRGPVSHPPQTIMKIHFSLSCIQQPGRSLLHAAVAVSPVGALDSHECRA